MKKSELRQIIREEIQALNEANFPLDKKKFVVFQLPKSTSNPQDTVDELDAELSRKKIYGHPNFNNISIAFDMPVYKKNQKIIDKIVMGSPYKAKKQ
jgi:hypothetical protein